METEESGILLLVKVADAEFLVIARLVTGLPNVQRQNNC